MGKITINNYSEDLYEAVREINEDFVENSPEVEKLKAVFNSSEFVDGVMEPFTDLKNNWKIKSDDDFHLFICVIYEHCLKNSISDINDIRKTWLTFKNNLDRVGENLRNITTD